MFRKDERTPEEVETIIRFSQEDSFWRSNILSTAKLREKFDQLTDKRLSQLGNGSNGKGCLAHTGLAEKDYRAGAF